MARAPTKQAEKPQTTAVVSWEDEMAAQAQAAAAMEAGAGGSRYFSTRGGVLSLDDAHLPNNQMAAVIVDHVLENVFYADKFDPDVAAAPVCFAFGRDDRTMAPHPDVVAKGQAQHATCSGCPMNEWGTADTGKGKACRNTRRLGLIPAGALTADGRFTAYPDAEHFETAAVAYLKLPVTSVKGFASFVKNVAGTLRRPPHGIFTRIQEVPDAKSQFKIVFTPLAAAPGAVVPALMRRHEEVMKVIEQPYNLDVEESAPARGKPAVTKNVRPEVKRPTKKY